jgi:hypothetical protein
MMIVIGLNCLLAVLVLGLACLFWQWRCALAYLNQHLQNHPPNSHLASQKMGYSFAHRRTQIAQARLLVARWQMRSRQMNQAWQILQILRTLVIFRVSQRRSRRRVNSRVNSQVK